MGTKIKFKGIEEAIPAIVVFSSADQVESNEDLVKVDNRNILSIHFPASVEYDTLINVYRDEESLSEITIMNDDGISVFVHLNYVIRISLSLISYGNEDEITEWGPTRWIMKVAQLTEADKQFRQIVGVVAKSASYLSLEDYRDVKIDQSKQELEKFLKTNFLISSAKDGIYAPYSATTDKQNLFASQFALYMANTQAGIPDTMTWNEHGKSCVPWEPEECLTFMNDLKRFTKPLVSAQQHFEVELNKMTSKSQLEAAKIDYSTVEVVNGRTWWIGFTKEEIDKLIEFVGDTPERPADEVLEKVLRVD